MRTAIISLLLLFVGILPASAQWSSAGNNTGSMQQTTAQNSNQKAEGFWRITGSLSFNTIGGDLREKASGNVSGILSLVYGAQFLGESRAYLGYGLEFPFKKFSIYSGSTTTTYNFFTYRFPFFGGYRFELPHKINIYAQTGFNIDLEFAQWGTIESSGYEETFTGLFGNVYDERQEDDVRLFNPVNFSWAFSAGVSFGSFYVGFAYDIPCTKIFPSENTSMNGRLGGFHINLGFCFDMKSKANTGNNTGNNIGNAIQAF